MDNTPQINAPEAYLTDPSTAQGFMDRVKGHIPPRLLAGVLAVGLLVGACSSESPTQTGPEPAAPSVTQETAAKPEKPNFVMPQYLQEGTAAEQAAETEVIIGATGWENLRNRTKVIRRINHFASQAVFMSIDGAEPSVPLAELETDLRVAELMAAKNPTFTALMELGPNTPYDVEFQVKPNGPDPLNPDPAKRPIRYFLFAGPNQDVTQLTSGTVNSSAHTVNKPEQGLSVSLLKKTAAKTPQGTDNDIANASAEAWSSTAVVTKTAKSLQKITTEKPDLSNLRKPGNDNPTFGEKMQILDKAGQQLWGSSWKEARARAAAGEPYDTYKTSVTIMPLPTYAKINARHIDIGPQYFAAVSYPIPKQT